MAFDLIRRADDVIEGVSAEVLVVAVIAGATGCCGAAGILLSRSDAGVLALTATLVFGASVAIMPFGLGTLPFAFVIGRMAIQRRALALRGLVPLFSGTMAGLGVLMVALLWMQPPIVECRATGVSVNHRPWWRSGEVSGQDAAGTDAGAASRGSVETPDGRIEYECRGGELTEVRRVDS